MAPFPQQAYISVSMFQISKQFDFNFTYKKEEGRAALHRINSEIRFKTHGRDLNDRRSSGFTGKQLETAAVTNVGDRAGNVRINLNESSLNEALNFVLVIF